MLAVTGGAQNVVRLRGIHGNGVLSVAFVKSQRAISSGVDGTARLWDLSSLHEIRRFSGKVFQFQSIALMEDGREALTPTHDNFVRVWNTTSGATVRELTGPQSVMRSVAVSRDGTLAAAGGQDTVIFIWNIGSGRLKVSFKVEAAVVAVAFGPDDSLRSIQEDGTLCFWGIGSPRAKRCVSAAKDTVSAAAFANDGRRLLIGGRSGSLRVLDLAAGMKPRELKGVAADIVSVDLSDDGTKALSGDGRDFVRMWDLTNGKQLRSVKGSGDYISCVRFAPRADAALFGSSDGIVSLWRWRER